MPFGGGGYTGPARPQKMPPVAGGFIPPEITRGGGVMPYGGGIVPPPRMDTPPVSRGLTPPLNSTVPPPMRRGGIGGAAPRPAQSPMMRKQRGRGGMSMF